MPIITEPHEFHEEDLYVDLRATLGMRLYLKCEGFNFAGSIKLKAAAEMVASAERDGALRADSVLVESSSGNLGVALSIIAANRGLRFDCVTDPRCNAATLRLMAALGTRIHIVDEPHPEGGLLAARLEYVRRLCDSDPRYVWINQYANAGNWLAHYQYTAPAIVKRFPDVDVVFIGVGTAGTLMGCARYLRDNRPQTTVVAVDAVGSVTFGAPAGVRLIPGLGMGVRPPLLDESYVDDVVLVREVDTVRMCHRLARRGFVFGGSTGTVVSGALRWLGADPARRELLTVAIAPDLGERYLDSVYQPAWVTSAYGGQAHDLA